MAYSNFTLEAVQETFQLESIQSVGIFSETEPIEPSVELTKALAKKVPLAVAIGTELVGKRLHIDMATYMLERCDRILGILASMVSQKV